MAFTLIYTDQYHLLSVIYYLLWIVFFSFEMIPNSGYTHLLQSGDRPPHGKHGPIVHSGLQNYLRHLIVFLFFFCITICNSKWIFSLIM